MLITVLLRLLAPLLLLVSSVQANNFRSINPPPSAAIRDPNTDVSRKRDLQFRPRAASPLGSEVLPRTNAERFARGLPPRRARFGRNVPGRREAPVVVAKRTSTPSKYSGVLVAFNARNSSKQLGYVRSTPNIFGEYTLTNSMSEAIKVSFNSTPKGQQLNLTATNSPLTNYPSIGGITGFASISDSLAPNSFNYAYIGGSKPTTPGIGPQGDGNAFMAATGIAKRSESAIWEFDSTTLSLRPQWINPDQTKPATIVGLAQEVLVIFGDHSAFQETFGPTTQLDIKFLAT